MALPLGYGLPATLRVLAVLCGIVVARRRLETYVSPKHKGLLSSPVGYYPTPLGALLAVPFRIWCPAWWLSRCRC